MRFEPAGQCLQSRRACPDARSDGGLAVGLLAAMQASGGLWFGWNGRTQPGRSRRRPRRNCSSATTSRFATISLARDSPWAVLQWLCQRHACGRCSIISWIAFTTTRSSTPPTVSVNALFAADAAAPAARGRSDLGARLPSDTAGEAAAAPRGAHCRSDSSCTSRSRTSRCSGAAGLPRAAASQLLAFDLLGFQTESDRRGFLDAVRVSRAGAQVRRRLGRIPAGHGASAPEYSPSVSMRDAIARVAREKRRLDARYATLPSSLHGRRLIIGVDRLDYSKGLLERFDAYQKFLEQVPTVSGRSHLSADRAARSPER